MTQKYLVLKWHNEKLSPSQIHDKLVDLLEEKAISVSTVSRTIRQMSWNEILKDTEIPMGRLPNLQFDSLILIQLYEDPTMSCREIAKATQIPYSSIRYVLINRLRYKSYNLKWIPHFLDSELKKNRVEYCQRMIVILEKCRKKIKYIILNVLQITNNHLKV